MSADRPMIQIKWSDENHWHDYCPANSVPGTPEEQVAYITAKFAETKAHYKLAYDIEVSII